MDRASKILVNGIVLVSFLSIGVAAFKYFVLQDYTVQIAVACDPLRESCFMSVCDPEEGECSSETEKEVEYYKIIEKSARQLGPCSGESCPEVSCEESEDCIEIFCDEEMAEEIGDECIQIESFPEQDRDVIKETSNDVEQSASQ